MAFSCLKNDEKIYSFHFTPIEWIALKTNKKEFDLTMSCCNTPAIIKTSPLGTQFFAHKNKTINCPQTSPETREHQFAKYLVSKTLYEMGWHVETEKQGTTPDGKEWIADIYAEKGTAKVAVEVQWSYELPTPKGAGFH